MVKKSHLLVNLFLVLFFVGYQTTASAGIKNNKKPRPTYVLVHGAWADASAWNGIKDELGINANVITVNLPGHGMDQTPANGITLASYVNAVIAVINQQEGKVILVGHSMGGMVISQVAESIPKKISKLIYIAAYLPQDGEDLLSISKQDTLNKIGVSLEFTSDHTAATIRKDMIVPAVCLDCPQPVQEALVKYHKAEPLKPLSEKVTLTRENFGSIPKYYISTKLDNAVRYDLQQLMIRKNGTIKKVYELNTSHLPFVVMPKEVVTILNSLR